MRALLPFIFLLYLSCKDEPAMQIVGVPEVKQPALPLDDADASKDFGKRFSDYLSSREERPVAVINNVDERRTEVTIEGHQIKWIDSEAATKVRIGDEVIVLDDHVTINAVTDADRDYIVFPNNWDQIRLYRIQGRDILMITMAFHPCTGTGCSLEYILLYDIDKKAKNFFGSFRGGPARLYNFGDGKQSFVSYTFIGDLQGSTSVEYIHNIYEFHPDGHLNLKASGDGVPYFVKFISFPGRETDSVEINWPYKIR